MLTCDNLRIHRLPSATVLQLRPPGGEWTTLRAARIGTTIYCCVGDPTDVVFYSFESLVPYLLQHEFDAAHPLPAPVPIPHSVVTLLDYDRTYLVRYLLGHPLGELVSGGLMAQADIAGAVRRMQDRGIDLLRISDTSTQLAQYEFTHRNRILPQVEDLSQASSEQLAPSDLIPEKPVFNKVVPIPDPVVYRLRKELLTRPIRTDSRRQRQRWPFTKMEPMTQVMIEASYAERAQRAAHVVASRNRWRIRTWRDKRTGALIVMRLDEPVETSAEG